jgi:hypothetical protein
MVAWWALTRSLVISPCVSNALSRASKKALRTAETGMGFLEGDGAGEVEFNRQYSLTVGGLSKALHCRAKRHRRRLWLKA